MTKVTSPGGSIHFGPGLPTLLINDQLYVHNKPPEVIFELSNGNIEPFVNLARLGIAAGMDITSILIGHPDIDEVALLPRLARSVLNETGAPLGLDTRNVAAIEAALAELAPYKAVIWTVTAEDSLLHQILPVAKKYGAVVAGMPMGRLTSQVPMTVEERIDEARYILSACDGYGIPAEDVIIDAVCMPAALLLPGSYRITLETIAALSTLGITSQIGTGNAASNLPNKDFINLSYLLGALAWGLDSAYINPTIPGLVDCVRSMDMLTEKDPQCRRFLQHWRESLKKLPQEKNNH